MFLTRRNVTAWLLLLVAALGWNLGWSLIADRSTEGVFETTVASTEMSTMRETAAGAEEEETTVAGSDRTTAAAEESAEEETAEEESSAEETAEEETAAASEAPNEAAEWSRTAAETYEEETLLEEVSGRNRRSHPVLGYGLYFVGAVIAILAVLLFWQETPVLGPDGAALLLALAFFYQWNASLSGMELRFVGRFFLAVPVLFCIREIWGWLRSRLSLNWCLSLRMANRSRLPQVSLLTLCGWILAIVVLLVVMLLEYDSEYYVYRSYYTGSALTFWMGMYSWGDSFVFSYGFIWFCVAAAGLLGIGCLWKYGSDLHHFQIQLDHFRHSQPIEVKEGTFRQTEAQLLQVQEQHREAIETAVTSERFKVELIANVSHDLRTPLTAILGYGELLQKEELSPEGRRQLEQLNQKTGYMRDLVEELFELTKVSSGVIESKRENIDIIRLLEQTIGLFDDQLTAAGLEVRRRYEKESLPVVSDGARMHQVFANLLGNAIKYALPGTRIYLEVREQEEKYVIRMTNTASYEMDFQPEEILQRFARGDKARSTKGSGLGLAIAQTYTESVGGEFQVVIDADQFNAIVKLPKSERNF